MILQLSRDECKQKNWLNRFKCLKNSSLAQTHSLNKRIHFENSGENFFFLNSIFKADRKMKNENSCRVRDYFQKKGKKKVLKFSVLKQTSFWDDSSRLDDISHNRRREEMHKRQREMHAMHEKCCRRFISYMTDRGWEQQ